MSHDPIPPLTPTPCPHCGVTPEIKREPEDPANSAAAQWYVACANELDCPVWPMTWLHLTTTEAITAWNNGLTH